MIRNFDELLFVIERCDKRIEHIKKEIRHFLICQNFKKVKELLDKQRLIELKMQSYISSYKTKLETNYLENKIFTNKLEEMEIRCQPKSIMEEVVSSVKYLQEKNLYFETKIRYLMKRESRKSYSHLLREQEEIENQVKNILSQGKILSDISKIEVSENLLEEYNSLLLYFKVNNEKNKIKLEIQLKEQKKQLLRVLVKFKITLAYKILKEIGKIKNEIISINNRYN